MTSRGLLAIDIGASKIAAALLSTAGVRTARVELCAESAFDDDLRALRTLVPERDHVRVDRVAVSFPGLLRRGTVIAWPNRPAWEGRDLEQALKEVLPDVSIQIEEDANLGAIVFAEHAADGEDLIYVNAGSGIGCGILIDGRLLRGKRGLAGELGHTVVNPDTHKRCGCGKWGCLQLYASGRAIEARLSSSAQPLDRERGSRPEETAIVEAARALALAVANLICVLDITQVHLGGGLARNARYAWTFVDELERSEAAFLNRALTVSCGVLENPSLLGALALATHGQDLCDAERAAFRLFVGQQSTTAATDAPSAR